MDEIEYRKLPIPTKLWYGATWSKASLQLTLFVKLKDNYNGDGALKPNLDALLATGHLFVLLMSQGEPPPNDVYPLPDGTIMVGPPGKHHHVRANIREFGKAEIMQSWPDRKCEFGIYRW